MYKLTEQTITAPPGIDCKFFMTDRHETNRMDVLVVSLYGEYPDGSRGNPHGRYIATMALLGLAAFDPDCIVLDFRELSYRWGDTILNAFVDISTFKDHDKEPGTPDFPVLVVTSERSRAGILSLTKPKNESEPHWHFSDLDEAIADGVKRAEEWLDA